MQPMSRFRKVLLLVFAGLFLISGGCLIFFAHEGRIFRDLGMALIACSALATRASLTRETHRIATRSKISRYSLKRIPLFGTLIGIMWIGFGAILLNSGPNDPLADIGIYGIVSTFVLFVIWAAYYFLVRPRL